MNRFESRAIVVTGASSGIELAVARRIAAEGGTVVMGGRREAAGRPPRASWAGSSSGS